MSDQFEKGRGSTGLEQALVGGCRMHAFLSGGGLRVIAIRDSNGTLKGYGEAPHVEDALTHASLDYTLGHETYGAQYGGNAARYSHYLTGSSEASSPLDMCLLAGKNIDAFSVPGGNEIVVTLSGLEHWPAAPRELLVQVTESLKPASYHERGVTYQIVPFKFPGDGSIGAMYEPVSAPEGAHTSGFYNYTMTGVGENFDAAAAAALEAEKIELI